MAPMHAEQLLSQSEARVHYRREALSVAACGDWPYSTWTYNIREATCPLCVLRLRQLRLLPAAPANDTGHRPSLASLTSLVLRE
jgi:hypothetical protein